MKKLLIGCGVVFVVLLGLLGAFVWMFMDDAQQLQAAEAEMARRLAALDARHAFDPSAPLDAERFAAYLDTRVELVEEFEQLEARLDRDWVDEDVGRSEFFRRLLGSRAEIAAFVPDALEAAALGPAEFRYASRLLWAVLRDLDKGAGPAALDPLRDRYSTLRTLYAEHVERDEDLPPLDVLIGAPGDFPPEQLDMARAVLAADVGRAVAAVRALDHELSLLPPPGASLGSFGVLWTFEASAGEP